jgi:outer membrane biosynthesis protein TonB
MRERKWTIMAGRKSTKTAAKTTETVVAEAIEPKAEEIKTEEIAETKATEPQEEPKKAPAKKTVGRPAKTARAAKTEAPAEEAPKAAKTAAKKAAPKATGKKAVESVLHVQYAGRSYSQEDLLKIARDVWKYDLKRKVGELESVEMYVKPEENKVYYVMNGEVSGCFDI